MQIIQKYKEKTLTFIKKYSILMEHEFESDEVECGYILICVRVEGTSMEYVMA